MPVSAGWCNHPTIPTLEGNEGPHSRWHGPPTKHSCCRFWAAAVYSPYSRLLVSGDVVISQVEKIRTAFERNVKALTRRPTSGQKTSVTKVQVRDGLTCDIEDGPWKLTADMNRGAGGDANGPDPGVLGRAALGSCLAIGYVMWAAKLGVTLTDVQVEVETYSDASGIYGVGDVQAGPTRFRYTVEIESPASEADILGVLDQAEAHSPYFNVFSRPHGLQREVRITAPVS